MSDQSTRDEMNAAIRAQRERHNVPRSIAGEPTPEPVATPEPAPEPEPVRPRGFLSRLRGK